MDVVKEMDLDIAYIRSILFRFRSQDYPTSKCTFGGIPIRKLYIDSLADHTTNKDLEDIFSAYGKVESCYLKKNDFGGNIAFVTFETAEDALKARQAAWNIITLHGHNLRVFPADNWHQPDSPENKRK